MATKANLLQYLEGEFVLVLSRELAANPGAGSPWLPGRKTNENAAYLADQDTQPEKSGANSEFVGGNIRASMGSRDDYASIRNITINNLLAICF